MILFLLFFDVSIVSLIIGFIVGGIVSVYFLQREKTFNPTPAQVSIPEEPAKAQPKIKKERVLPRPGDLGAVTRPSAEELKKRANPRIAQEEAAWDESLGKESAAAIFNHPNNHLQKA